MRHASLLSSAVLLAAVVLSGCNQPNNSTGPPGNLLQSPGAVGLGSIYTNGNNFRILAGSTVANTGLTTVNGDVGVWAGTSVTGFGPGTMSANGGLPHAGDVVAQAAQSDLTVAYNNAAARPTGASVAGNLGGQTLTPGVYTSGSSLEISSGDLTLDARGNSNAVFIFQIPSALTVTSGRRVILSGGARAINVFWQVGSSATLGTTSDFSGTILANTSISLLTGARLHGRALARTGAVTTDAAIIGI